MKTIISVLLLITTSICMEEAQAQTNNSFDSVLAKRLGADEYGMKSSIFTSGFKI